MPSPVVTVKTNLKPRQSAEFFIPTRVCFGPKVATVRDVSASAKEKTGIQSLISEYRIAQGEDNPACCGIPYWRFPPLRFEGVGAFLAT